jgi:uroporphyrin-3 C-methyltransferase
MIKPCLVQSLHMEKIMTDKKLNESNTSEKKSTEKKSDQGISTSISLASATTVSSSEEQKSHEKNKASSVVNEKKPAIKTSEKKAKPSVTNDTKVNKQKLSKTAVVSLIIALATSVGVGGLYYWDMQQQAQSKAELLQQTQQILATSEQKTQQSLASSEQKVKQLFAQQQTMFSQRLNREIATITTDSQVKIAQLEKAVERLSQNQPSDWLLHEAEYLIRIATRTMWLEQDTRAAIGLLKDADMRLKELKDPQFLPIRQLIRQDIAQLTLIPVVDNEDTVMTLMAMSQQLANLPLAMVKIPDNDNKSSDFTLSESTNDWRENLAKTWQKILADFITVRRSSGNVKPLMSPQHQQNLIENLSLKLQLAQWAVTEKKQKIYNQTLNDIQLWLTEYFDMQKVENQSFYQAIQKLKGKIITYDYPSTLLSLKAMSKVLAETPLKPTLDQLMPQVMPDKLPEDKEKALNGSSRALTEEVAPQESKVQPNSTNEAL